MHLNSLPRSLASVALMSLLAGGAFAQFRDDFNSSTIAKDPNAMQGWTYRTGDGTATMDMEQGDGFAAITVDATHDKRGIWWAMIRHYVSANMDLARLSQPGQELRVEARVRVSSAPKRVNLHFNTQRTTDFHSHLMEFDLPEAGKWYTLSMTTRDFDAVPGDQVFAQMALMDWGLAKYEVDLDYFKADIVDVAAAGPDLGNPLPYRPPLADPKSFHESAPVAQDSTVDLQYTDMNFNGWSATDGKSTIPLLSVNGTQYAILRFDLSAFHGRKAAGSGLLELTSYGVERLDHEIKDFGEVRVTEILGGDPQWEQQTVTLDSLCQGQPWENVINTQMIIDVPIAPTRGGKTLVTISQPVLQRLLDGRTRGIVIRPLGSVSVALLAMENNDPANAAKLLFNLQP